MITSARRPTFDGFPRLEDDRERAQPCGRRPIRRDLHDRGEENEGGRNPDHRRVRPKGVLVASFHARHNHIYVALPAFMTVPGSLGRGSARFLVPRVLNDRLSPRTRRRLARSPYAPIGEPVLRTDLLVRLVMEPLASIGPRPEGEVLDAIDQRAPGRGPEVITSHQPAHPRRTQLVVQVLPQRRDARLAAPQDRGAGGSRNRRRYPHTPPHRREINLISPRERKSSAGSAAVGPPCPATAPGKSAVAGGSHLDVSVQTTPAMRVCWRCNAGEPAGGPWRASRTSDG
jgi:hypothetical protein